MLNKIQKNKGFTLIELLVVMAIVGVLATVVMSSLNSARMKSRDAKRQIDLGQIQVALALYRDACNLFPVCQGTVVGGNPCIITGGNPICSTVSYQGVMAQLWVVPTFISSIPNDPINGTSNSYVYGYYYARGYKKLGEDRFCATGRDTDYVLATRREGVTGNIIHSCGSDCAATTCSGGTWNNNYLNYLVGN